MIEEEIKQELRGVISEIDNSIQEIEYTRCLWLWAILEHTWQIRKKLKELKSLSNKMNLSIQNEIKGWFIFLIPLYVFPLDIIAYIFLLHTSIAGFLTVTINITIEKPVVEIITKTVERTVEVPYYWFWKTPKKIVENVSETVTKNISETKTITSLPSPIISWGITIGILFLLFVIITYLIKWYLILDCRWLSNRLKKYYLL